jgi:single-stranded-DNA-specific exonuclease
MKQNWQIKEKESKALLLKHNDNKVKSEASSEQTSAKSNKRLFPDLEKVTENILISRGIDTKIKKDEFLYPDYDKHTYDPNLLSDIDIAVERILQARENKELICIYGDYDVDGITSSTILHDFFQQVGIKSFTYLPDRNKEGYGLNNKAIDYIIEKKADLIVTVDCGITSVEEVAYANKKKMEILITDHHFVPKKIPRAVAVINPKKKKDKYPEKMLAGVGVTFKFIQAISQKIKGYDLEQLKWFLDLVAVGNVADCVPLLGENRTLTKFGLMVLAKTRRVGLKQLFEVGKIKVNPAQLPTGETIGFQIAPRINAAGRMGQASAAYELLIRGTNEASEARLLALKIEEQNKHRQKVTQEIIKEVNGRIDKKNLPAVIIESDEHWSLGIVGLVAGRVADKYNRPSIILQNRGNILKGSCRSVPTFHLMKALTTLQPLLEKFGGHAQAAGLTIKKENLKEFKKEFTKLVEKANLSDTKKSIIIDQQIEIRDISMKLLDELIIMEPFGQGNKKPIFLSQKVVIKKINYLGIEKKHLKIFVVDSMSKQKDFLTKDNLGRQFIEKEKELELISFNYKNNLEDLKDLATGKLREGDTLDIVYTLEENIWNGQRSIQARLIDLRVIHSLVS